MSILTYNGITFGPDGWHTLSFNQEAVRDSSGTQTECMRIVIEGQIVLSQNYEPTPETGPAAKMPSVRVLKDAFMQDKGQLSFTVNGNELIPSGGPTGINVDCKNGPIPEMFRVDILTEGSFICTLRIVSHWAEASANAEQGTILSHRWRDSSMIDANLYTHSTRTGKIVVSPRHYNQNNPLDISVRESLITTSIYPGFLRESAEYVMHENGCEMSYTLRDVEQFRMPPWPATTADGVFNATTQRMGTPGRRCEARYTLRGPKKQEANPQVLIRKALAIAFGKCRANGGFFPTMAVFSEQSYKNEVTVMLSGMNVPQGKKVGDRIGAQDKFLRLMTSYRGVGVAPLGSEPGAPVADRNPYGTAPNALLHAAAYHDPTLAQTLNKQTNQVTDVGRGIPGG